MYPKISIITPSFNQGKFLEQTIISVLNQNYPNLEYIIIDGGSSDNSIEVIKRYKHKLSYWISEPDRGQSDAINKGFNIASGKIFHWLNSDDILTPNALFYVANYFNMHPKIDCVLGDQEVIDEEGNVLFTRKAIPFKFYTALFTACLVPQPSSPFRKSIWESTGDLDINLKYQMDFEYYLRMAKSGAKFGLLRKNVSQFRIHSNSKTVSEYKNLFYENDLEIKKRYLPNNFIKFCFYKSALKVFEMIFKVKIYITRALMRGDFIPFRSKRARRYL